MDTKTFLPFSREDRETNILFVGSMEYEPNVDAIIFVCYEIYPLIREKHSSCTLTIAGKTPPENINRLNNFQGVTVRGDVEDVRPYYQKTIISIAPLRSGGGTRLKILESMALGTPVVSTSVGCEGLDVENHYNIIIADDPADFAQGVANLLDDSELWNKLSHEGRILVEEKYDWKKISKQYCEMLEELISLA